MNKSETDCIQAELTLVESNEIFKALFENGPALTTITDVDGKVHFCSPQCEKVIGWPISDIVGLYMPDFVHPDDKERVLAAREKATNLQPLQEIEYRICDKQKNIRWVSHSVAFAKVNDAFRILSTITNITERKKIENDIKEAKEKADESESRYYLIADNTSDSIWVMDAELHFTYLSPATERLFGYSVLEWETLDWNIFVDPDYIKMIINAFNELQSGKQRKFHPLSVPVKHKNGTGLWVEFSASGLFDKKGVFTGVVGITRDITERKRVEEELKKRNFYIESILANMPIGFAVNTIDDGDVKFMNKKFEEIYGWPRDVLTNVSIFFESVFPYPEHRAVMMEKIISDMQSGDPERMKWENLKIVSSTNEERYVNAINIPLPDQNIMISTVQDMTERKRMEEELQKSQKLESLGLLAGGIAHDFNNLMGGIFGYIDMASEETKEAKVTSYLSKAMNTIERARALTGQLLTFAKGGAPIQKIDNLFPFVEETARFALSGANVSCHLDVQQDLWACNFDKNQIGQVIDNLIINAQQAMPVGGTIELTARNISLAEKEHPLLVKGNYVKIAIKDAGIGIPKELIAKIFDPFFTTKPKGHGLGLATCYSIIKRHEGCIDVESEPGKGSTFKVYLPASTEAASSVTMNTAKMHKGSGTFLIMDDEGVMRDTIGDMLETLGYTVVSKENGKDAIGFFASEIESKPEIVGMIFDLTVPGGMGGKAAIEEIRKTNTDIPAFVASGYTDDLVMKNPTEYGFMASICKPFRKSELSDMLNTFMKPKK